MELKIVENNCPYCNEILFMNKRSFANHVRWCKMNPRYDEILQRTVSKLSGEKAERKEHLLKCEICGNEFSVKCTDKEFLKGRYKHTCSDICAKRLTAKKAGEEKKEKISKSLRKRNAALNEEYDENKGIYIKKCKKCGKIFGTNRKKQCFCSHSCASKFRYLNSIVADDFKQYKKQCEFRFLLKDYPEEYDFFLIETYGWYKAKNHGDNLNGVSRDHMFSIKEGYKNKIDPYYISHPANCKLLKHTDNVSKLSKCSLTEKELLKRICEWETKYGKYENKIDYFGIENFKNQ